MLIDDYTNFINEIYLRLTKLGINTDKLVIDHLGYQVDSATDYDDQINKLKDYGSMVSENLVGGRRVGIFKLNQPLLFKTQKFAVIEVFEPRTGQVVPSAWEHIEFLTDGTPEDLIEEYSGLDWDTSALLRDEFPMLILSLGDSLRAKFPRQSVLAEVRRINNHEK